MQPDLTPKQQTSEAIRQAETILITTGQHPSVDQVTAVLALAAVLRKFGKKVSVVISDTLPTQVQFLDSTMVSPGLSGLRDFIVKVDLKKAEVDKLRYEVLDGKLNVFITPFQGGFEQNDVSFGYGDYHFDLAIVLGVPTRARIDRVYADNQSLFNTIPVLNLDYHRSNEGFGAVNLIESTASSLCEILVALSESLQTGLIDADIATIMLTGLISSTDRFTAAHTTSKSMTVAAQLMAAGARQQAIIKGLYRDNRDSSDRQPARSEQSPRSDQPARNDQPPRTERPARQDNRPAQQPRQEAPRGDRDANRNQPELRPEPTPNPQPAQRQDSPTNPDQPARTDVNSFERLMGERPAPPPAITPSPTVETPSAPFPLADPASVDLFEPIINPSHIEMSQMDGNAPIGDQLTQDVPAMADFAAAAQFLRRDNQNIDSETQKQQQPENPSEDADKDIDQSGAKSTKDQS